MGRKQWSEQETAGDIQRTQFCIDPENHVLPLSFTSLWFYLNK
jgi:hypothetical protein